MANDVKNILTAGTSKEHAAAVNKFILELNLSLSEDNVDLIELDKYLLNAKDFRCLYEHEHPDPNAALLAVALGGIQFDGRARITERNREEMQTDAGFPFLVWTSAWGPNEGRQDQLCRNLFRMDETVVVANQFVEEFYQEIGVRLVTLDQGQIIEFYRSCDAEQEASQAEKLDEENEEVFGWTRGNLEELINQKLTETFDAAWSALVAEYPNRKGHEFGY